MGKVIKRAVGEVFVAIWQEALTDLAEIRTAQDASVVSSAEAETLNRYRKLELQSKVLCSVRQQSNFPEFPNQARIQASQFINVAANLRHRLIPAKRIFG